MRVWEAVEEETLPERLLLELPEDETAVRPVEALPRLLAAELVFPRETVVVEERPVETELPVRESELRSPLVVVPLRTVDMLLLEIREFLSVEPAMRLLALREPEMPRAVDVRPLETLPVPA